MQERVGVVAKDKVREGGKKLKIIREAALARDKVALFEKKYGCRFREFEERVKDQERGENLEEWDDYIEWKAYTEALKNLDERLTESESTKDAKVV